MSRQYKEIVTNWQKSKNDFQTPTEVAHYMISLLKNDRIITILEPTPGLRNIALAAKGYGYHVTEPQDYFLLPKDRRFDAVVMNPPFSHKFCNLENAPVEVHKLGMRMGYWFLTDCMINRSERIVALMPWFTITDSDVRLRMLKRWGMRSVTALPRKTFQFARIQTVVLDLEKGYKGETLFKAYDCLKDSEKTQLEIHLEDGAA